MRTILFHVLVIELVVVPAMSVSRELAVASDPVPGQNAWSAGGGGQCTYSYSTILHDGVTVVESAKCAITSVDLNTGSEPSESARKYVRALGDHDGCGNDDAGHILANQLGGYAVSDQLIAALKGLPNSSPSRVPHITYLRDAPLGPWTGANQPVSPEPSSQPRCLGGV